MHGAAEALYGAKELPDENPLTKLPNGFIPRDKSMVFTVTVLANTIAQTMRQRGFDFPTPHHPPKLNPAASQSTSNDDDQDEDDIPLSKLA